MIRTIRTWLAGHPFTVYYTLASALLIASTLVPDVHPAYWIGGMFGFVVCPLLRLLIVERAEHRRVQEDRDAWKRGLEQVNETLRQGAERVQTPA